MPQPMTYQVEIPQEDANQQRPAAGAVYSSFFSDLIFVCCGTVGAAYMVFLIVGVPIAMVYVGFTTTKDCPVEPMIPIYLIISGLTSIFRTIIYFLEFWVFKRRVGRLFQEYIDTAMCVMNAGMVTLFLMGLYWVLSSAWPNLENTDAYNYCNPVTYLIAFVTIIGILVMVLFWCLCICTLAFQMVPVVTDVTTINLPPATSVAILVNPV